MKTVMTAILLTAVGGGAALAQGAPPGFAPWQSGWRGAITASQAQALGTIIMRPDSRNSLAGNGRRSTPVARVASREPAGNRAVN